jgi:hypothetical protein
MSDLLSVTGPTARISLRAGGLVDGPGRDGPERPGQPAPLPLLPPCPAGLPHLAVVLGLLQQPGDALPGVVGGKLRVRRVHDGASSLGQQNFMRRP